MQVFFGQDDNKVPAADHAAKGGTEGGRHHTDRQALICAILSRSQKENHIPTLPTGHGNNLNE